MTKASHNGEIALRQSIHGVILRMARERGGHTPEQCAKWLGLPTSQVLAWEAGTADIPITLLVRLANRLGLSLTEFSDQATPEVTANDEAPQVILRRVGKRLSTKRKEGKKGIIPVAGKIDLPVARWIDVESGDLELGAAALATVAHYLEQPLYAFLVAQAPSESQGTATDPLAHLDPELRSWVANPANASLLALARQLTTVPADHLATASRLLRDIAAAGGK